MIRNFLFQLIRPSGRPPSPRSLAGLVLVISLLIVPTFSRARDRSYVVVVSIDGLAPFYMNREDVNTPNLDFLTNAGVSGLARSVFPSMTWPAHTSIVTGASPGTHGVLGNRYLDRKRRRLIKAWSEPRDQAIRVPTIYDATREAGMRSAALLWPGTAGARGLDFNIPELYLANNYSRFVAARFRSQLKAAGIPFGLFPEFSKEEGFELDFLVRDTAVHVIEKHRPELVLAHFVSLDTYAHRRGPNHPRTRYALQLMDTLVGDLIQATQKAGIYNDTTFFIVADHGFLEVKRCIDLNRVLSRAGLLRNYANPAYGREKAAAVYNGHTAYVYLRDPASKRMRSTVKRIIQRIPEVERIYTPEDYAELGLPDPKDDPGMGDLMVLAKPNAFFGNNNRRPVEAANYYKGMHGYLPDHPEMQAGFIIAGPGVIAGRYDLKARLIDFAPTILSVLEILPPKTMEGRVLKEIFIPPPGANEK